MQVRPFRLALLALGLGAAPALAQDAAPWRALAGDWTLNAPLSDGRPKAVRGEEEGPARRRGGPPPGSEPGGGPGGFGGGGMHGPGGDGPRGEPPEGEGRRVRTPLTGGEKRLLVGSDATGIRVSADGGDVRILTVGGEPVERRRGPATATESVAWEGESVLVRSRGPDGRETLERFSLSVGGRLVHSLTLPGRERDTERTLTWLYDRTPEKGKK